MTNRAGTSFAQNVKTLRMERPNRLVATVFHVARGCLRHLPQRDKAGERERPSPRAFRAEAHEGGQGGAQERQRDGHSGGRGEQRHHEHHGHQRERSVFVAQARAVRVQAARCV